MPPVESSTKREYAAIDIAKLICALLVVAIHTEPFASNFWLDKGFGVLTRIPVPYFFMASGYFLFLADKEKTSFAKLKKYCLRILLLYAVWSVFYLPLLYSKCTATGVFNKALFFKSIFWLGTQGHLWYLIASIVAAIMTWGFLRVTTLKKTVVIAFIFLIFGTLFSNYAPLIHKLSAKEGGGINMIFSVLQVIGTRNGIFYGFFYVALGALIAGGSCAFKMRTYAIAFLISFMALAVEGLIAVKFVGSRDTNLWFSAPPLIWSVFMATLQLNPSIGKNTALMCRNGSTLIYTSHRLFIAFLISVCAMKDGMLLFIATTVLTLLFSTVVLLLKNRIRIFKYLY